MRINYITESSRLIVEEYTNWSSIGMLLTVMEACLFAQVEYKQFHYIKWPPAAMLKASG